MKVLALDYGRARTGVAVSDPSGTVARPLTVVERAETGPASTASPSSSTRSGRTASSSGSRSRSRGARASRAEATRRFVDGLSGRLGIPIELFDERFTTRLAELDEAASAPEDARAAHLLSTYLEWSSRRA